MSMRPEGPATTAEAMLARAFDFEPGTAARANLVATAHAYAAVAQIQAVNALAQRVESIAEQLAELRDDLSAH